MGKKLYVGNLSYDTTEETLNEVFGKYGQAKASIIRFSDSGKSRGFGFVEFEDDAAADAALEMNQREIDGRTVVVNEAKPQDKSREQKGNKIYVGNLSYDLDDGGLKAMFEQYGEIESATIIRDRESGRSKGFGFVQFASADDAEKALEVSGQEIDGRKVVVKFAMPREDNRR